MEGSERMKNLLLVNLLLQFEWLFEALLMLVLHR